LFISEKKLNLFTKLCKQIVDAAQGMQLCRALSNYEALTCSASRVDWKCRTWKWRTSCRNRLHNV